MITEVCRKLCRNGGLIENIPRILPDGLSVTIKKNSWPSLPVFSCIQSIGEIEQKDLDLQMIDSYKEGMELLNNNLPLNIMELAGLIKKSSFVIANDTGPAHMAAHLGKSGVVIFGSHTTPEKVSIETKNFKAIKSKNLKDIMAQDIYLKIKKDIELIN